MPAPRIDKETIERMLLAYLKDPNPTHVATACDVSWQTAKKYIQEGAPLLGIGPFASEARRILRAGDKLVRLTEVTKQVRVQVEEKDLGALQTMLFEFEDACREGLQLVRARIAREKQYFIKCAELRETQAPEELIAKLKKPGKANMHDIKAIGLSLRELYNLKREFWDRMEVVTRTEVTTDASTLGPHAEGVIDATPPPVDFEQWAPHEIAAYVDSVEAGEDPVFPAWLTEDKEPKAIEIIGESASPSTDNADASPQDLAPTVAFPPGGIEPE